MGVEEFAVRTAVLRTAAAAAQETCKETMTAAEELGTIVPKLREAMAESASGVVVQRFAAAWAMQFAGRMGDLRDVAERISKAADRYDGTDETIAADLRIF